MSRLKRVVLAAFCGALTVAGLIFIRLGGPDLFRRPAAAEPPGEREQYDDRPEVRAHLRLLSAGTGW